MNKTEQQLADELDEMVTAVLQGSTTPTDQYTINEARLAANLIDLSAQTNPDASFVAQLQRRLSARANQLKKSRSASEPASFWRDLIQMLKEGFTMKRTLALGAVLTLILLFGAVALGRGFMPGGDEPQVAEVTPIPEETLTETDNPTETPEETVPPTPAEELAELPRFEAQAPGMGGGGGGDGTASADAPIPTEEFDLKMMNPFSGTTFILNVTLPIEPVSGFVQLRQPEVALTPEQARAIADQYGLAGPLYVETYGSDISDIPPVYIVFDGPRNLRLDSWAINYTDETAVAAFDYENPSLTIRPEIVPVAEAFLAQRGQLNFPYVAEAQLGDTVAFYRLVDGRKVNEAELSVSVNPNNEVAYVWDNTSTEWTAVGNYPLITAEQAWQRVLAGVLENHIQFQTFMPDSGVIEPVEEPDHMADYQYWGREFTPNIETHLYEWPVVYRPVDGGTPLLKIRGFTIAADDATLNTLAEVRNQQLHFWGTLNEDKTLFQLAGWEALAAYNHAPIFQVGVVRWQGDELRFYGEDGSIYILPNAPADIAEGLKINLFGYGVRDAGLEYPVLDWESIDKFIEYPEPELPGEGEGYPADGDVTILPIDDPFVPFRYGQVTVNHVELLFFITYAFPDVPEGVIQPAPTIYLQPAWAFTGTADNGDTVKLFVQAVADEYLQP